MPAPSPPSSGSKCLCVFDIDRTLTAKQGSHHECAGTRQTSMFDSAYGGGDAVLSALSATGIRNTACNQCYLGLCSAGHGSGENSEWNKFLMGEVIRGDVFDAFMQPQYKKWYHGTDVHSPYALNTPNKRKQDAVDSIRKWYGRKGVAINPSDVYFFGDRTENIGPFKDRGFNSREVSCNRRAGHIGHCGATPSEVNLQKGNIFCR